MDLADFASVDRLLSVQRLKACYGPFAAAAVQRFSLPHLGAVHFVMHGALSGGVTRSLALDAHGKALSSLVLALPLEEEG